MKRTIVFNSVSIFRRIVKNYVYTSRTGLTMGLKRIGGFGFIPRKSLSLEHAFMKSLDLQGKNVFDVGGHIGLMTMAFARKVGETGSVTVFEPNPENYDIILNHIKLNGFDNVMALQLGLGRKRETLKFVVAGNDQSTGSANPVRQARILNVKGARSFYIEVDTLDNQIAVNNLPRPDLIKVDVEGLELDVLYGMTQTIINFKPKLLIELHGQSEREIGEFLISHNYKINQIEANVNITSENINSICGHLYCT